MSALARIITILLSLGVAFLWVLFYRDSSQNAKSEEREIQKRQPRSSRPIEHLEVTVTNWDSSSKSSWVDEKCVPQIAQSDAASKFQEVISEQRETSLSTADALLALEKATVGLDENAIQELFRRILSMPTGLQLLKQLVLTETISTTLRRYAAETLVSSGLKEGVEFVVDRILAAKRAGDTGLAETLQHSLTAPTSVEGARVLFDLLLGTGRYAGNTTTLPEDLRSTVRKAIRLAPDQEAIGDLAAEYYLDPQISSRNEALLELFDGLAQPGMLSALAVRAYQAGSPENAGQFLDRLAQSGDPAVVRAFVQAASQEPALLNIAAEKLYAWTMAHRQQAQPGLFIEYLTDSTRPAAQRIVAAFGLVGIEDTQEASRALNKALAVETDSQVRASLASLQGFLQQGQQQKQEKTTSNNSLF